MTLYDDMPPGIELGGGGFIPPPPGASQGGQPYNPFPGASAAQSSSAWPPAPAPPWSANAAHPQAPTWFSGPGQHAQAFPAPPATAPAHSWAYGQPPHHHYPTFTPQSGWSAPTPAGSWGDATPAGSWGPPTPASAGANANAYAYAHHSPWVNPQPGVGAQESTFGQPITASPWFSGGGVTLGAASPGFGADTQGQGGGGGGALALVRKNSRHSHPHPHGAQNDYPNLSLQRTMSHDLPAHGGGGFPLHRTMSQGGTGTRSRKSSGNLQPFSLYQQMQDEQYSTQNLARRPRDWRPDYDPRAGLASYIPRVPRPRSDVIEWHDPMKRTPHEYLAYKPHQPPLYLDLRFPPPLTLEFLQLRRAPNQLDFAQLATQPAAQGMRLVHPLLPWYIDVVQSHENGITVHDVVWQMCVQLDVPIQARHWYNEELDAAALEKMNRQFQRRTAGNPEEAARGVKRVDFLRGRVVFEGLVRTRNGLWEMKTRKWEE